MKKSVLALIVLFLAVIVALPAHPAASVTASFDKEKSLLSVNFRHQVKDNKDHFITDIVIERNKKEVLWQKLSYQDTLEGGTLVYKINDLKPKDKLNITTTCNKIGKKNYILEIK